METTRAQLGRQMGGLALLAVLGAGGVLFAWVLAGPPLHVPPWAALLTGMAAVPLGGWAGWAARQAWSYPVLLRRAERLWDGQGPAAQVESLLDRALLARGEVGYRIQLLRLRVLFAQGRREEAWRAGLAAERVRLPLLQRLRSARGLSRRPDSARQHHRAAAFLLKDPRTRAEALHHLDRAAHLAGEDPLLLEDVLLTALAEGQDALAGAALERLLERHQDPRLPWDRAAGAALLLRQGRRAEAAALVAAVPPSARAGPEIWAVEAAARRGLGDLDGADAAVDAGLAKHPGDFRLWMESHALAMEDRAYDDAFGDLEEARRCLGEAEDPRLWEWEGRRAAFAWWVDGDARTALHHLDRVPPEHRQGEAREVPPLRLHLRAALGEQAEVLEAVRQLEGRHPGHAGLAGLHAECLAGLEDWDALDSHLQGLDAETRQRPEFIHLRGRLLAARGRLVEARDALEGAAALDPGSLRFVLDAGRACADLDEWDRSEAHWKQALRIDGACEEALLELAESRLALHDRPGAIRYLRECLLNHPDSADAQGRLAELESQ